MYVMKLKRSVAASLAVAASCFLPIATVGFTQEKPETKSTSPGVSARTKAILTKLEKRISMPFPNETPLEDILNYIKQATNTTPSDPGLPIYVDLVGLRDAGRSLTSTG
jgi:hypothetical protein